MNAIEPNNSPAVAQSSFGLSRVGPRMLAAVAALLAAVLLSWMFGGRQPSASAVATDAAQPESITVTGTASVRGTPDVLRVDFGVETRAATVETALSQASTNMDRMRDVLSKAGVKKEDLQTANLNIYPRYDNNGSAIVGYQVSQSLIALVRDLDKAGAVITKAVNAGGNTARINGMGFDLEDNADLLEQARKDAVADAKAKADLYADAVGRDVSRVIRLEEQSAPSPQPIDQYAARVSDELAGAAVIEPGSQAVTVTIVVEYAFS